MLSKKVLVVINTGFVPYGGLTTVMMNYYRAMSKAGLQIDFASTNESPKELLEELHSEGSEYYCLGNRQKNLLNYQRKLKKLLKEKRYDIVHINGNSVSMCIELSAAKKADVPVRIAHVHNSRSSYRFIVIMQKFLQRYFNDMCTYRIAVSDLAGKWLYGRNYIVLNNAIDVNKYRFNENIRTNIRKKLKLENKFVVGNVAKLNVQKNHVFLLAIFAELRKKCKNAVLLLVGGGVQENTLKEKCYEMGIENEVLFTGMVDNSQEYLQAMDVFVFPSLYEGLGMAVIEAQASGLTCIASDKVPIETKVSDNIEYLSLEQPSEQWADHILQYVSCDNRSDMSNLASESIRTCGYDIEQEADKLRKIYLQ